MHLSTVVGDTGEVSGMFEGTSDHLMRGMRIEMEDRYRNIQNATAMKVINRFFKKTVSVD